MSNKNLLLSAIHIALILTTIDITSSYAQSWVLAGTITNPGQRPSISIVNYSTAWVADGTVDNPKVFRTINGGLNWISLPTTGIAEELYCIWATAENTAFTGEGEVNGNARLFYTSNAGVNWVSVVQTGQNQGYFNGIIFSRRDATYGFAIAERIFRSTNSGLNWTMILSGVNGVSNAHNSLFMIDGNFYGFGMNNGAARVRLTTNDGSNWMNQAIGVPGNYTSAVAFADNKLLGVAATSTSLPLIARTVNGGQTWSDINIGTGLTGASKLKWVSGSSVVYIMGENGAIKRSLDNGLTWSSMPTAGVTNLYHFDFIKLSNVIYGYAVSSNGSVIKLADSILITGAGRINSTIPSEFKLYQNYPNPFNPSTVISFDIPKSTFTRLVIYDVLGRETETLLNEEVKAGHHEMNWDASGYASGIYYYSLYAEDFRDSKKMILTK